jgi:hypothetical protein
MKTTHSLNWLAVEFTDLTDPADLALADWADPAISCGHQPGLCWQACEHDTFGINFGVIPGFGAAFGVDYQGFASGGVGSTAVAAAAIRQVAKEAGDNLPDDQVRMLLGHAAFESGFGRGDPSKNTLANTNNWGSVQATKPWVQSHLGKTGFGAVAHQDSDPRHKTSANPSGAFVGWYAVYPNQLEGARAFYATVRPALSSDIDTYASNLYHRGYYTGFSTDAAKEIASYAKNIRAAMPRSAPADTSAAVAEASRFSIGPLAPWANRMTAKDKVDGKVKFPASSADAEAAWNKSWSSPGAYGLDLVRKGLAFADVAASGGIVWIGSPPPGFSAGGSGVASLAPYAWSAGGAVTGALVFTKSVVTMLIGGASGAVIGYVIGRLAQGLVNKIGTLSLGSGPAPSASGASAPAALPQGLGPDRVKAVQTKLNNLGFGPIAVDGKAGPLTAKALEKFQKQKGLMMTGILDTSTLKGLGA